MRGTVEKKCTAAVSQMERGGGSSLQGEVRIREQPEGEEGRS